MYPLLPCSLKECVDNFDFNGDNSRLYFEIKTTQELQEFFDDCKANLPIPDLASHEKPPGNIVNWVQSGKPIYIRIDARFFSKFTLDLLYRKDQPANGSTVYRYRLQVEYTPGQTIWIHLPTRTVMGIFIDVTPETIILENKFDEQIPYYKKDIIAVFTHDPDII